MRIIAGIEDPDVIEKILTHLDAKTAEPEAPRRPPCRAPPQASFFDRPIHDDIIHQAASSIDAVGIRSACGREGAKKITL